MPSVGSNLLTPWGKRQKPSQNLELSIFTIIYIKSN